MNKLLGAIWVFLVYQLFAGYMVYQHGYTDSTFALFFRHQSTAPLLLLQVGMVIYIVLLALYLIHLKAHASSEAKLPILFVESASKPLTRFWEIVSLISVAGVPWVGFIWMWVVFHNPRQKVWEKNIPETVYGLYDKVSSHWSFAGNWDNFQYGRPPNGDSFVPFWQQIFIMVPLSIAALLLTVLVVFKANASLRDTKRRLPE